MKGRRNSREPPGSQQGGVPVLVGTVQPLSVWCCARAGAELGLSHGAGAGSAQSSYNERGRRALPLPPQPVTRLRWDAGHGQKRLRVVIVTS